MPSPDEKIHRFHLARQEWDWYHFTGIIRCWYGVPGHIT